MPTSRSPKRTQVLDNICKRRLPHVAPTRWQYTSRLVNAVYEKRAALKELFDHILEHHDEYDEDNVHCADGFNARLDDFEFCFFFCLTHSLGFLSMLMLFFFNIAEKNPWMSGKGESFVTQLSEPI